MMMMKKKEIFFLDKVLKKKKEKKEKEKRARCAWRLSCKCWRQRGQKAPSHKALNKHNTFQVHQGSAATKFYPVLIASPPVPVSF